MDDLTFLETFWSRTKEISDKIENELPIMVTDYEKVGEHLYVVQFKDLDNWSVNLNESETLKALSNKISYMIYMGRSKDIKPMITKIASGRIKKLTKKIGKREKRHNKEFTYPKYEGDFLGYGHFRWNYRAYILTEKELKKVKDYFGL